MAGYLIQRLTAGEKLDQSFRLLRDHFVPLTVPFMIAYIPYSVAIDALGMSQFGGFQPGQDPTAMLARLGWLFGVLVLFATVMPLAQLVANYVIADAYLGQPTSLSSAFSRSLKTFLPYLGTSFLMVLALIPLTMLFCVPGIYFGISWMLIGAVVVVEHVFGTKAMKRSRDLVKGYFWNTFAMMLIATMMVGMATGSLNIAFQFIPVVGPVLNGIVQAVGAAYSSAVLVILYVDLRCRHEDFDLQLLAQQIAGANAASAGSETGAGTAAAAESAESAGPNAATD